MIELLSTSRDHTVALGQRLGQLATPGDVIALDGQLGAGKTQLVRGLAQGLGLDPTHVSSPTFVFMHEYTPEAPPEYPSKKPRDCHPSADPQAPNHILVHIDAYRLTGPDDLTTLGFDDELRDTSVTAVEWADLIDQIAPYALGQDRLTIQIEHAGQDTRRLTLTPHGRWQQHTPTLQTLANPLTPGQ